MVTITALPLTRAARRSISFWSISREMSKTVAVGISARTCGPAKLSNRRPWRSTGIVTSAVGPSGPCVRGSALSRNVARSVREASAEAGSQ